MLSSSDRSTSHDPSNTGTPFWWREAPRYPAQGGSVPAVADVVVVGSGYAGSSAARTLARNGREVLVLERDRIGEGASSRSGGAVGETLRISYNKMRTKFGEDTARAYYTEVREARTFFDDLLQSEEINCHYRRCGRVMCAHSASDYEALARDLEARNSALGFDAEMVPKSDIHRVIGSDAFYGARVIHSDANLQPAMFHDGLVAAARRHGVTYMDGVEVVSVKKAGDGMFRVSTHNGTVKARDVVMATNGYTARRFGWLARRIIPIQSQIIATEELPRDVLDRLIPENRQMGDTRKLHNYWRIAPDGKRILFGGRAGAHESSDRKKGAETLKRQMTMTYPELQGTALTDTWTGFIAYTFDSLPHIARHDGVHYVGGCCGSGVVMQPWLGHRTALNILGKSQQPSPFDTKYRTIPGYFGKPWFLSLAMAWFGYQDNRAH